MRALLFLVCAPLFATTYCVSNSGSDSNSGTATLPNCTGVVSAWQTIAKVNAQTFSPGDSILFQAGGIWREQLTPSSGGASGSPVTYGRYGVGARPIINGSDVVSSWVQQMGSPTGAVTQANMKMSTANGVAFVDFSLAGALTPYSGDLLTVTDHTGKTATGYISAAGTGETYGSQLISNPNFTSNTTGWTTLNSTIASVAGGQSGNCLQVTRSSGTLQGAYSTQTLTSGWLILSSVYVQSGTSGNETAEIGWSTAAPAYILVTGTTTAAWTQMSIYGTADSSQANYQRMYLLKESATAGTMLFDTASATQVLTPSVTGVTIASTSGGSTFNWASITAGFNLNDTAGYTYSITATVPIPIWSATVTTQPNAIWSDGVTMGVPQASFAALVSPGQWFWGSNSLSIYSATNPSTGHTVESASREEAIYDGFNYLNFVGLEATNANSLSVSLHGTNAMLLGMMIHDSVNQALYVGSGGGGETISGCSIYNSGLTAGFGGGSTIHLQNETIGSIITGNQIYNFGVDGQAGDHAIYDEAGGDTITYNHFQEKAYPAEPGLGIRVDVAGSTFAYNIFDSIPAGGIDVSAAASSISIYNNTFYAVGKITPFNAIWNEGTAGGVTVKNNLVQSATGYQQGFEVDTTGTGWVSDYNLIYDVTNGYFGIWLGAGPLTLANWQSTSSQDSHSLAISPLMVNPSAGDFRLSVGSLAIAAGVFIPGVSTSNPPNIGALGVVGPSLIQGASTMTGKTVIQ